MILSKTFAVGDSKEIGRKDLGSLVVFLGFNIGIIFALPNMWDSVCCEGAIENFG